jgi:hypothetical protein
VIAVGADAQTAACSAPEGVSLTQRLDGADAAVVGRVVAVRSRELRGLPQRLLAIDVDQHVKGSLPKEIVVWTPSGTACDLRPPLHKAIGLLLTRSPDDRLVATAASRVNPGELVVTGGEPRGGSIKVVVGLVFLLVVVFWALSRRRRGIRPELPGPPPR